MDESDRRRYTLTVFDGTPEQNRSRLQDELDNFWTCGALLDKYESRSDSHTDGQVWTVYAEEGFVEIWNEEAEFPVRTRIEEADADG
jgi:hypothetical protein